MKNFYIFILILALMTSGAYNIYQSRNDKEIKSDTTKAELPPIPQKPITIYSKGKLIKISANYDSLKNIIQDSILNKLLIQNNLDSSNIIQIASLDTIITRPDSLFVGNDSLSVYYYFPPANLFLVSFRPALVRRWERIITKTVQYDYSFGAGLTFYQARENNVLLNVSGSYKKWQLEYSYGLLQEAQGFKINYNFWRF